VSENGVRLVRVDFEVEDTSEAAEAKFTVRWAIWFNPERSYLVHHLERQFESDVKTHTLDEVVEYFEYEPGRFVPRKLQGSMQMKGGEYRQSQIIELADIKVNQPISDDVFALPRAAGGGTLLDRITNTEYAVDENWKQAGPATPHQTLTVPKRSADGGDVYLSQTRESRWRINWIVAVSVLVLMVAGALYVYRRVRRDRPQD
jgi:hypothetical protein